MPRTRIVTPARCKWADAHRFAFSRIGYKNAKEELPIITVSGMQMPIDTSGWTPLAVRIFERKMRSPVVYRYASVRQVRFEMELRAATVNAAEALSRSGMRFADFHHARCNEMLWSLTPLGGFRIRDGVPPAAGIRDIIARGFLYATECATATVIALYKAVLDAIGEAYFNRLFRGLHLYNWSVDDDLRLGRHGGEMFPGDLLYFDNPDVNPATPQWRGENAILIWDDLYYGHPVGIVSGYTIIEGLNRVRIPGSMISAYLADIIVRPDYAYLSQFAPYERRKIIADIGARRYVQ